MTYFGKSAYAGLFKNKMNLWGKQRVHPKIKMLGNQGRTCENKRSLLLQNIYAGVFKKIK